MMFGNSQWETEFGHGPTFWEAFVSTLEKLRQSLAKHGAPEQDGPKQREPVPLVPISPRAAQALGKQLAAAFGEFTLPPEGQLTTQRRLAPGTPCAVQLKVAPSRTVVVQVSAEDETYTYTRCVSSTGRLDLKERIATAVALVLEKVMTALSEGYKPPELSYAEEHEPDLWNEVPKPYEPPKEEDWPASQHGGMKWLN